MWNAAATQILSQPGAVPLRYNPFADGRSAGETAAELFDGLASSIASVRERDILRSLWVNLAESLASFDGVVSPQTLYDALTDDEVLERVIATAPNRLAAAALQASCAAFLSVSF